jgi:hypothetical protein
MGKKDIEEEYETQRKNMFAVNARDIKLHQLYANVMADPTDETHQALKLELENRMKIQNVFETTFGNQMEAVRNGTYPIAQDKDHFECYR